jgi:aspartate carbamoyltransferase catalytic subunit
MIQITHRVPGSRHRLVHEIAFGGMRLRRRLQRTAVLCREYEKPSTSLWDPIIRGVEIEDSVADDPQRSLITLQVEMGVAVRMACLEIVVGAGERP